MLDIAIVLLLVAAVCTIGYRYYAANTGSDEADGKAVQVRFAVESVLPGTADELTIGDVLYWENTQQSIGTLVQHPEASGMCSVAINAAEELLRDANGNYVSVSVPEGGRVDLEGLLDCRGTFDEQRTFLLGGRYTLTPGQRISVYTERVTFVLTVLEIVGA